MTTQIRNWILAGLIGLLAACGGGGGSDRAAGVEPGPEPPGPVTPPPPVIPSPNPAPYAEAETLLATITSASIDDSGITTVDFQLTDGQGTAIIDLEAGDVRFTIAKLETSELGNMTGNWQSYINTIEEAGAVGPGTENKLQATYERVEENFVNHGDGTYTYTFGQSVTSQPAEIEAQAESQGLDLSYDPSLTTRVAMQFDGNDNTTANPHYDWVPATGATSGIFTRDIATVANCNRCHDPLELHGGNRREIAYCDTCHNPGTADANSGNTVDLKVMIHKIHMGANLPSVQAGTPYVIYGFRDSEHNYSDVHFPQDIRNCVNCHAGTATGGDPTYPEGSSYDLTLTSQGDNWSNTPSPAVCGSCHDGEDAQAHIASKEPTACASCHSEGGIAGSIPHSHTILTNEARKAFAAQIVSVSNTAPGQFPEVQYKVFDPSNGNMPYDLATDPVWTTGGGASRLAIDLGWPTTDYTNTGNGEDDASAVSLDALAGTPVGDGSYMVTSSVPVPPVAADGSGVAGLEGHPAVDIADEDEEEPDVQRIAFTSVHKFFSVNEPDGQPVPRRTSVETTNCLYCHQSLSLHGSNRTDDVQLCVICHNPRNTDLEVREQLVDKGLTPPTDGLAEQSIHFKVMIHAIHAAGMRDNPIQVVGFGGNSVHVYDEEEVQFPGDLANCTTCHTDDGYTLPLPEGVLGTTVDTGADPQDPADDTVVTPIAAACSACHDHDHAIAHMKAQGASFNTTQAAIDSGEVVESCVVCHETGAAFDVAKVHEPHTKPIQ